MDIVLPVKSESDLARTLTSDELEDYKILQETYLQQRVRTGTNAQIPANGMRLRRQIRLPRIDAYQYKNLKKKFAVLKKRGNDAEIY